MNKIEEKKLLKKVHKVDWRYLVNRKETTLIRSLTDSTKVFHHFKKITGIDWKCTAVLRLGSGEVFYSGKELDALRNLFLQGGVPILTNFKSRLIKYVSALDTIGKENSLKNYSTLSHKQLINEVDCYFNAALTAHKFLSPMPIADGALSTLIVDALPEASSQQKQEWVVILTFPIKENEHTFEERSFLKLVQAYEKEDPHFAQMMQEHLQNFSWIGARWGWWENAWTENEVLRRIEEFVASDKNQIHELQQLNSLRKERAKVRVELIKKLKISESSTLYQLISLAQEYAYLRTWRTDVTYRAIYRSRNLLYETAHRAGINPKDIVHFSYMEIEEMAKSGKTLISSSELQNRRESVNKLVIEGEYRILSGKEWEEKLRKVIQLKPEITEVKGNIAFPGKARGRVRIVLTSDDIHKFQRGDILVAVMTFPHFIPAMEKAAAFVTDEGGILCHAAIVSREMKKPCIIATKNATKVLKDGDIIEVDANKGIVRILKP